MGHSVYGNATVLLSMAKRIVAAVVVILVVVVSYFAYKQYAANSGMRDGEVTSADVRDSNGNLAQPTPTRSDTPAARTSPMGSQSASMTELQAQSQPVAAVTASTTPATDSQTPDAPNGQKFSGSGKFEVYRQGNLTWRIDTDSGTSCILFATEAEWRKPIVYSHACNNS